MHFPNLNLSDVNSVKEYANNTGAILKIKSVVTDRGVEFPAFLTDFSQTFDATWNTEDVFGRMDPIATYQGTKRTMTLAFDVPAGSLDGAIYNLDQTEELVKMVYPVYNNIGGNKILSKPPLVRIKFANLITGIKDSAVLGWISGLSWSPDLEMGMFVHEEKFFPKTLKISFNFNVLHETTLDQSAKEELSSWPFGV